MFRVSDEMTVRDWPVDIHQPIDGGKVEIKRVAMDFILPDAESREALMQGGSDRKTIAEIAEYVTGWEGFEDEHGQALAFTREALVDLMCRYPFVAVAVMHGLRQACIGAPAKN